MINKNLSQLLTPKNKALSAVIVFAIAEVVSLFLYKPTFSYALPLLVFYIILVFNTFFSIKLFSSIISSSDKLQIFIDIILFIIYLCLALSIASPSNFVFFSFLLFIVASVKYFVLFGKNDNPKLFKKKFIVDLLGAVACGIAFKGVIFWNVMYSIWILDALFFLANILLFTLWPLYVLDNK